MGKRRGRERRGEEHRWDACAMATCRTRGLVESAIAYCWGGVGRGLVLEVEALAEGGEVRSVVFVLFDGTFVDGFANLVS